jgi:hypothetical protein
VAVPNPLRRASIGIIFGIAVALGGPLRAEESTVSPPLPPVPTEVPVPPPASATSASATSAPAPPAPPPIAPALAAPTPIAAAPPVPAPAPAKQPSPDDAEGEPKLSLPTEADRDAWRRTGFRMGLSMAYGQLVGLEGAPSGRLLGALLRLGIRLDGDWSLMGSLQYDRASAAGGLSGLRFAGTLDPTWHVTNHLSLAIGLGFGGIVEGSTSRPEVTPLPGSLSSSYTFPSASPPLPSCSGVGVAALARAEWTVVLGPRSTTSVALEAVGQWTGCVDDTGLNDSDTGQAIVRRQWWPHTGGTLQWGFTWR